VNYNIDVILIPWQLGGVGSGESSDISVQKRGPPQLLAQRMMLPDDERVPNIAGKASHLRLFLELVN